VTAFLNNMKSMLSSIEDSHGTKLVFTQRRICIVGLISDIDSVLLLYDQLVMHDVTMLN
jgi:hypothetical protein